MDMFDLTGRVAVVTGGNGGIGFGMARGLARAGASVAVVGRDASKSTRAVSELESLGATAVAIEADVTESAALDRMAERAAERLGGIDILVNNAGTNIRKRPEDMGEDEWHTVMDTNITSAFLASKACYPFMKRAGGGKILNNGSMMSIFGAPWAPAYAASKGGMVQLTRALATAWAEDGIQVNCFLPDGSTPRSRGGPGRTSRGCMTRSSPAPRPDGGGASRISRASRCFSQAAHRTS